MHMHPRSFATFLALLLALSEFCLADPVLAAPPTKRSPSPCTYVCPSGDTERGGEALTKVSDPSAGLCV